ncbi:fumarylacetoacetate hydrolase family protein [Agromyces silvae]|uniref:fumarylacetoacetate hydrolase family protein n=1 Tax=Agromyces silvae TaxID=3388266 RepID=UPI00280BD162|nr:fumarylacetoacetate hydrolase family protein [Agromyces protaetiae]
MRFLSYTHHGATKHGVLRPDGDIDELGDGDLLALIERGGLNDPPAPRGRIAVEEIEIVAPLRRPPKLLAVAANYASHVLASGGTPLDPRAATPRLFLKPSSAVAGPQDVLTPPSIASNVDWEVELAVVIGTRVKDISPEDAMSAVAGYMTANDISTRAFDFGFARDEHSVAPFFDWLAGKWSDGYAPFGPYLVSADEVPDPGNLELHLEVNGEVRQSGSTSELLFGIPELISFASTLMTLEPGDVIETGTTAGAGIETGLQLADGDVMVARVGDLGEIRTAVRIPAAR